MVVDGEEHYMYTYSLTGREGTAQQNFVFSVGVKRETLITATIADSRCSRLSDDDDDFIQT